MSGTWTRAVKKFKPSWVNTVRPDWEVVRKYRKHMYWQCKVVFKQTTLSFSRTTTPRRVQGAENTRGEGVQLVTRFSSTTLGQNKTDRVRAERLQD